jgi:hypothetical protein
LMPSSARFLDIGPQRISGVSVSNFRGPIHRREPPPTPLIPPEPQGQPSFPLSRVQTQLRKVAPIIAGRRKSFAEKRCDDCGAPMRSADAPPSAKDTSSSLYGSPLGEVKADCRWRDPKPILTHTSVQTTRSTNTASQKLNVLKPWQLVGNPGPRKNYHRKAGRSHYSTHGLVGSWDGR